MSAAPLHTLNPAEVWEALEASPAGLPADSVAQRLALYGANALREPAAQPAWRLLLSQGSHAMALVLLEGMHLAKKYSPIDVPSFIPASLSTGK